MNTKKYTELALNFENLDTDAIKNRIDNRITRLLHACVGASTESAELLDAIKKHIYYGKELNRQNIKEELGDILWYVALACDAMNVDMGYIMEANIEKLSKRYPEGYTNKDAINRNTKTELKHIT